MEVEKTPSCCFEEESIDLATNLPWRKSALFFVVVVVVVEAGSSEEK